MSEATCSLVSSRGIAKSCDDYPNYSSPQAPSVPCQSLLTGKAAGPVIYLRADTVSKYIHLHVHRLSTPVVIVIGDDDNLMPDDHPSMRVLLDNPFVRAVWSQNYHLPSFHPKLHHLPIGLDYHTLSYKHDWHPWGESGLTPAHQESILLQARDALPPIQHTKPFCVTNFHHGMTLPRRAAYRVPAYRALAGHPAVKFLPLSPRTEFWYAIGDAAFVISPPGNGLDTHRTWEALALGRIPIVQRTGIEPIFEGLPVLIVNSYEEITQDLLTATLTDYVQRWDRFDWARLTLDWWMAQIRNSFQQN